MNTLQFSAMMNNLEHIGPWEITGRISNGAFGVVFSAQRRRVDRTLQTAAIKLITPEGMNNSEYRDLFVHEFRVLQGLHSKYIPSVVDSGIEEVQVGSKSYDLQWFAMDEIRGDNLATEIERLGPLEETLWLELAHDLLSAVAVTHSNRLIHQDIKPANIMRFSRHSVLVDFGGASFVHIEDPGDIGVYTLGFCAPEQIAEGVDPSQHEYPIDLFSVGATLAYAGTKVLPWAVPQPEEGAKNEREANASVRRQLHNSLTTTEPNLFGFSPAIREFLAKLLDADPSKRGTADEALQAIKDMLPEGAARKKEAITDSDRQVFIGPDARIASPEDVTRLFGSAFTLETASPTADAQPSSLSYSVPRPGNPNVKQIFFITVDESQTAIDAPFASRDGAEDFVWDALSSTIPWGVVANQDALSLRTTVLTSSVYSRDDFSDGFRELLQSLLRDARALEFAVDELRSGRVTTLSDARYEEDEVTVTIPRASVGLGKKSPGGLGVDAVPNTSRPVATPPKGGLNKRL
jgi:serine/threonine protein kinase